MSGEPTNLYVIRHSHGFVKIGKSDDPQKRLKSLQTACPYELELLTKIKVLGDWRFVESRLHHNFEKYSVSGEWFDLPHLEVKALQDIDEIASGFMRRRPDWTPLKIVRSQSGMHERWILEGNYEVVK